MGKERIKLDDFINDLRKSIIDEEIKEWVIGNESDTILGCFDEKSMEYIDFPYEYVETQKEISKGEATENFFIFKRKSDGKHFSLHLYKDKIVRDSLREVKQIIHYKWD